MNNQSLGNLISQIFEIGKAFINMFGTIHEMMETNILFRLLDVITKIIAIPVTVTAIAKVIKKLLKWH